MPQNSVKKKIEGNCNELNCYKKEKSLKKLCFAKKFKKKLIIVKKNYKIKLFLLTVF
jgi:hypothetical protein